MGTMNQNMIWRLRMTDKLPNELPGIWEVFKRVNGNNGNGGAPIIKYIDTDEYPYPGMPEKILYPALHGDVGYDLVAKHNLDIGPAHKSSLHKLRRFSSVLSLMLDITIGKEPPPSFGVVRTGVCVELPEGYWGAIVPRSSSNKIGLIVPYSVIDNGYRGELFPMAHNLSDKTITIKKGQKIAQLVVFPMRVFELQQVVALNGSMRGAHGFGSTGA